MKQKRFFALVLSMVLILGCVTACTSTSTTPTAAPTAAPSPTPTEAAEWKPEKTIQMIVTFAAGGGMDTIARTISSYIKLDGVTMYVSNIEGGGGCIGIMEAYHSDPDGYTLMVGSPEANSTNYISGSLEAPANTDMVYVCSVAYDMNVLCVAPNTYTDWNAFMEAAKADPGKLNIASVGSMNSMQSSITDVLQKAGIECNYVPYDSASKSRTAAMGGHADALWCQLSEARAFLKSGELVAIGLAGENRTEIAPDIPTFTEMGVNAVSGIHRCVLLPPGTPDNIAEYYETQIKAVYDNPEFQAVIKDTLGYQIEWLGRDDMVAKAAEIQSWAETLMPVIMK